MSGAMSVIGSLFIVSARVIVLGFRMLDEEQCRAHLEAFRVVFRVMGLHDGTVEHRLEDVVAVFGGNVCQEEDIVDALDVAGLTAARLIVDDTQPLHGLPDVHPVEAIHPSAHSDLPPCELQGHTDVGLMGHDLKLSQPFVEVAEHKEVAPDDSTVDELQAVECRFRHRTFGQMEELFVESDVQYLVDLQLWHGVHQFRRTVEDVSEDTVVNLVLILLIEFLHTGHITVEELHLAAHIGVDGRREDGCC